MGSGYSEYSTEPITVQIAAAVMGDCVTIQKALTHQGAHSQEWKTEFRFRRATHFVGCVNDAMHTRCLVKVGQWPVATMKAVLASQPGGHPGLPKLFQSRIQIIGANCLMRGAAVEFIPFSLPHSTLSDHELRAVACRVVETLQFMHLVVHYAHTRLTAACIMLRSLGADAVLVGLGHCTHIDPAHARGKRHQRFDLRSLGRILHEHIRAQAQADDVSKLQGQLPDGTWTPHWIYAFLDVAAQTTSIGYQSLLTICSEGPRYQAVRAGSRPKRIVRAPSPPSTPDVSGGSRQRRPSKHSTSS